MITVKNIFPECDADTLLVELITERGHPNHCKGISKVSKALERRKDENVYLIGIVDSDEFKRINDDKYLIRFTEIIHDLIDQEESLLLKKIPNKDHYIIFIHKEFEPWVWRQAEIAEIDANTYGFVDLDSLYKESKHYRTSGSIKFKKFVKAVVSANPPGIKFLKQWLVVQ